ncbi:MAG: ABC transporter permease [Actinobacteria bacterium]|nr:ABC transporter permease [Actinomycetota bacterium]
MSDIEIVEDDVSLIVPIIDEAGSPKVRVRRRGRVTKWLAIGWLTFIVVSAIGANSLPYINHSCDQFESKLDCSTALNGSLKKIELPPTWAFFADPPKEPVGGGATHVGIMGTDRNGYDIFARAMLGARPSLTIAGLAITFGLAIATILGMIAGYFRGWVDVLIENITNVLLAFPALLLVIFCVTFFTDNTQSAASARPLWPIILALVIVSIPPLTRLVRANTISYAQRDFVVAARSLGAKGSRIMFKEILPNIVPALVSFALTGLALLIVAEGALAFLGLSVEAPTPTWGKMISAGTERLRNDVWWISLMPALTMFLTVLSINLLGDVLSQRFNTREAIA